MKIIDNHNDEWCIRNFVILLCFSSVPSPDTRDKQLLVVPRNVCDNSCQTELTLPPILPKEVEDALRPYFTFMQNQQKTPSKDCDSSFNITMQNASVIDHDARDASLRRKLLYGVNVSDHSAEYECEVHLDSPAPQTPEMVSLQFSPIRNSSNNDDFDVSFVSFFSFVS